MASTLLLLLGLPLCRRRRAAATQDRADQDDAWPPGFRVSLFAGEPGRGPAHRLHVRRPAGRLWVVECLSYPKWTPARQGTDPASSSSRTPTATADSTNARCFTTRERTSPGLRSGLAASGSAAVLTSSLSRIAKDATDRRPRLSFSTAGISRRPGTTFSTTWSGDPTAGSYGCNGIQSNSRVGKPGARDGRQGSFLNCGVWRYHPIKQSFEARRSRHDQPMGTRFR